MKTLQYDPNTANRGNSKGDSAADTAKWAHRDDLSAADARLNIDERTDQRYSNYTYGKDADYADDTAKRLQDSGAAARSNLDDLGYTANWRSGNVYDRAAPTTDFSQSQAALGGAGQTALNQGDLYSRITAFAEQGPGPSIAQAQLNANTAQAMRQQLAMAGSGRGAGGGASAFRQAAANQAQIQGAANAQASTLQAQEADMWRQRQLQAYGQAGTTLEQQGGLQTQIANMYGDQSQFLTNAELQSRGLNDQSSIAFGQQAADAYQAGAASQLGYEQEASRQYEDQLKAGMGYEENLTNQMIGKYGKQGEQGTDWLGTALGAAAAVAPAVIGLASDVRNKTRIQGEDLAQTYRALGAGGGAGPQWQDPAIAERERQQAEADEKREREKTAATWGTAFKGVVDAYRRNTR